MFIYKNYVFIYTRVCAYTYIYIYIWNIKSIDKSEVQDNGL